MYLARIILLLAIFLVSYAHSTGVVCPQVCEIKCPNGHVIDEYGCQLCECEPPCPLSVACDVDCPYGFYIDENGCDTCKCLPNPCSTVLCPPGLLCMAVRDTCKMPPCRFVAKCSCPKLLCKTCEYGNVIDSNGCTTCECKCPPVCKIFCPYGNVVDANGCKICKCKLSPCAYTKCQENYHCVVKPCEIYEYMHTAECVPSNCKALECKPGYHCEQETFNCFVAPCYGPPPKCVRDKDLCTDFKCEKGYKCELLYPPCPAPPVCKPYEACPQYECKPIPTCVRCPLYKCMSCPTGYEYEQDEFGCNTCNCVPIKAMLE